MQALHVQAVVSPEEYATRDFSAFDSVVVLRRQDECFWSHALRIARASTPRADYYFQCDGVAALDRRFVGLLSNPVDADFSGCVRWKEADLNSIENKCSISKTAVRSSPPLAVAERDLVGNVHVNRGFLTLGRPVVHPIGDATLYNRVADILAGRTAYAYRSLLPCTHSPPFWLWMTSCCRSSLHDVNSRGRKTTACRQDSCSTSLPRCQPTALEAPPLTDAFVHITNLNRKTRSLIERLRRFVHRVHTIHLDGRRETRDQSVQRVSADMAATRLAFLRVVERARRATTERLLLWIAGDALLSHNFERELRRILSDPVCSSFLAYPGGILLLGASDEDARWDDTRENRSMCYDAFPSTTGSSALLISSNAIGWAKTFLLNTNRPFDDVFVFLQRRGLAVRVVDSRIALRGA